MLQTLTAVVLLPVLALLLRAATSAAGVPSLNDATLGQILTTPVSVAVLAEHGLARESLVLAFDATLFAEVNTRFPEVQAGWVVAG